DLAAMAVAGYGGGTTVQRCSIHDTGNAVQLSDTFTVEDSYIYNIYTPPQFNWHADGVQSDGSNVTIRHNTIFLTGDETGAVNVSSSQASDVYMNVVAENNLLGGGGYTVYAGGPSASNIRIDNNRFTTRFYPKVGAHNIWWETYIDHVEHSGNR